MPREKKLDKEDLREDEFVEWVMQAVDYVRARYQIFVAAAVAAVLLVLGVDYIIDSQAKARLQAAGKLGQALIEEEEGNTAQAVSAIEAVAREYDGTPAAAQSVIVLANRRLDDGDIAGARELYQRYLDEYGQSELLVYAARSGLAACLEAEGRDAEAAQAYEAYADEHPSTLNAALALWEAAECYERLGQVDKQESLLRRITREHGSLPLADQARAKLAVL